MKPGGAATLLALVNQVKVAKNAEENERNGQLQALARELCLDVGGQRVQRIGHKGRSRDHGDQLVEEVWAVLRQVRPMAWRFIPEQDQFVPALGKRDEQRQQRRANNQPGGY